MKFVCKYNMYHWTELAPRLYIKKIFPMKKRCDQCSLTEASKIGLFELGIAECVE